MLHLVTFVVSECLLMHSYGALMVHFGALWYINVTFMH